MQIAASIMVLLLAAAGGYYALSSRRKGEASSRPGTPSNVIPMDRHRKAKQHAAEQQCSSCRKKNGKLIFYAQDNGSVVGLCKECRAKAKKRDMMPL
ncbi:hypothetical protein SAMN03159358_1702 [Paenibacillus sp. NFR01]|nr:hypothetical protein SAMN03159358_1702 [Paenibacillus sp. NFR01]